MLRQFYGPFAQEVEVARAKMPRTEYQPEPTGDLCPECGQPLVIRRGRRGKFIGCSNFPACRFRKPILVTRETTERPEAVEAGAAELVGTCRERIVERVSSLLTDEQDYARHQIDRNPYGDGHAAERIVDLMLADWELRVR